MYVCMFIYIYIWRERDIDIDTHVGLADLQEADDAAAGAVGRGVVRLLGVVLGEHLERQLHAVEALLHLGLLVADKWGQH